MTRGGESLTLTSAGAATGVAAGYAVVRVSVAGSTSESQAVFVGDVVTNPSGLKYIEKTVGTGVVPSNGQTAVVNYTGALLNGTIFDSSLNPGRTPFSVKLGASQVIKGFEEGISTMKVGGKRLLIIPSELGYGATGSGASIPPNSTLIFDLELLEVNS
ncbi:FKBP-type peptidyl-prolyl cis-trans isomerase [Armatimonas sp.]|uniref:FKBP-type peptidyl-prolyl cis-trans isomerase n=1 Tax=Armatimonas sp. TaxID=1872638 RepID=UPI003752F403